MENITFAALIIFAFITVTVTSFPMRHLNTDSSKCECNESLYRWRMTERLHYLCVLMWCLELIEIEWNSWVMQCVVTAGPSEPKQQQTDELAHGYKAERINTNTHIYRHTHTYRMSSHTNIRTLALHGYAVFLIPFFFQVHMGLIKEISHFRPCYTDFTTVKGCF